MILRWLGSLGARLTFFIIIALIVAQIAAVLVFVPLTERQRGRQSTEVFFRQVAAAVNLFNASPDLNRNAYLRSVRQPGITFWIARTPRGVPKDMPIGPDWPPVPPEWDSVQSPEKRRIWFPDSRPLWVKYSVAPETSIRNTPGGNMPIPAGGGYDLEDDHRLPPHAQRPAPPEGSSIFPPPPGVQVGPDGVPAAPPRGPPSIRWRVAVLLSDGEWLIGEHMYELGLPPWMRTVLMQNIIIMALMIVFVIPAVGYATKRLTQLAQAADRVGRGEDTEAIPETGTSEIRRLTQAFNNMSLRLRRFVVGRTQMLAGISHDLRTPITALRLRADLVDDDENRERMLALIDDMHHLTEATLTLARDDSFTEKSDLVDVSSLIEGVCDDMIDAGIDVTPNVDRGVTLTCRPYSLRRAIRNLAENGAKYGYRSRITLSTEGRNVRIVIDDDGPGIPEDEMERAFQPFVRLEGSRSRETGGSGLGLAITRSIILNHGGDITLANRPEGGLRATVQLPMAEGD